MKLKFATWNIGGGILGESHQLHGRPEVSYHEELMESYQPDIVCLQEAHEYADGRRGQVAAIAEALGFSASLSQRISPSHLESGAFLTLGILSRYPLSEPVYHEFPNPNLSATGPNGEKWILFDKGYLTVTCETPNGSIRIVNAHMFPLHYFGVKATDSGFKGILDEFNTNMARMARQNKVLAAVDLNSPEVESLLHMALKELNNCVRDTPSTPKGVQQDYLLVTPDFRLRQAQYTLTAADHSFCQVELEI